MVTESSNTAYACASCGQPVRTTAHWDGWEHFSRTSHCTDLRVVTVHVPLPRTNPYAEVS